VRWSEVEWSEVEWSEVEWSEVEWRRKAPPVLVTTGGALMALHATCYMLHATLDTKWHNHISELSKGSVYNHLHRVQITLKLEQAPYWALCSFQVSVEFREKFKG